MKPVEKGFHSETFSDYKQAKPELLNRLGEQCSYCEQSGSPQDLHVEHIYPKKPHPELEKNWKNFLIACNTCNTYKHHYQGDGRQTNLEAKFIWPHLENTFRAFVYKASGEVKIAQSVPKHLVPAVSKTRDMLGLLQSPAVAKTYKELGLAYDGASKRSQNWNKAEGMRQMYSQNPSLTNAKIIANNATSIGYFSIWMEVFSNFPEVRRELIRTFKADLNCFDGDTQPVPKGRL